MLPTASLFINHMHHLCAFSVIHTKKFIIYFLISKIPLY